MNKTRIIVAIWAAFLFGAGVRSEDALIRTIALIAALAIAFLSYRIAEEKGKNKSLAAVLSLFFSIFALTYYILASGPDEHESRKED